MLVLFFVALCFSLPGALFHILLCVILFLCFPVLLALRLPRLFSLPLGVWEGLWFFIVALPGLFSYTFFFFFFFFFLTICLWLGLPCLNFWFSFTLSYSRISDDNSSLFTIVMNLNFVLSL